MVATLSGFAVAALAVGGYAPTSTLLADASVRELSDLDAEIAATRAKLLSLEQESLAALKTELANEEARRAAGAAAVGQSPPATVLPSESAAPAKLDSLAELASEVTERARSLRR